MSANQTPPRPVVHLELHTFDQVRATAFYAQLLHWRTQVVRTAVGSYLAFNPGGHLGEPELHQPHEVQPDWTVW
jgi:predicted enzyme related to lactoylglutathione lyase